MRVLASSVGLLSWFLMLFVLVSRHLVEVILGVDIWTCLCWVGILFLGFCGTLWILGKHGGCGLPGGECLCRLVGGRGEWHWAKRKSKRGLRKELRASCLYVGGCGPQEGGAILGRGNAVIGYRDVKNYLERQR